ncbi:MAG: hypothetical protein Q9163_006234 [Psora crenata]
MSTQTTGDVVPADKPKGMAKFKRRMSKILRTIEPKRATTAGPSTSAAGAGTSSTAPAAVKTEATPTAAAAAPAAAPSPLPPAAAAAAAAAPIAAPKTTAGEKPASTPIRPKSAMNAIENSKIQEEKIRAVFAKYNMTLDVGEWTPPFRVETLRVEKKVRMRVHRTCHRCQTQFGVDRVCSGCNHNRCKKCPRFPTTKKEATKEKAAAGASTKRPATQRTRSSDTALGVGEDDPPFRLLPKWTCHLCQNVHRDPENPCLRCEHRKCRDCAVEPPKPDAPPGGDQGLTSVEERMKTMSVSPQASAA